MTVWHSIGLNSRIIIIHPNYRYHRYLLSTLLSVGNATYLRFDEESYDANWLRYNTKLDFLILDEFDRLSEAYAQEFLEQVLNEHGEARIILFSRHLPDLQPNHRIQASIFPIDEDMGLIDYFGKQPRTVMEFFGFGTGAIALNGKRIDIWQDESQALMLFYLLEKGRVRRETLLKVFWEDLEAKVAIKALHNLKTRLKEIFALEPVIYRDGFYQLNPEIKVVYDVATYQRLVDAASFAPQNMSEALFAQAHDAYKGDFLQGQKAAWVRTLRHALRRMQSETHSRLAQIYVAQAQEERATAWYSFAFKHNPARDDVVLALMKLFLDLEMPCHALKLFNRHEEMLREKHGISPSKRFEPLYQAAQAACED